MYCRKKSMLIWGQSFKKDSVWLNIFVALFLIIDVECENEHLKKCMRNDDIGWRQGNIYYCDDPSFPECCEVDKKFTCCEPRLSKTLREQFQLWGTVVLFFLVLGVVYLYFRRDGGCCTSDTISESFKSLRGKFITRKKSHSMTEQYKEEFDSGVKLKSSEMNSEKLNWQYRKKRPF